MLRTATFLLFFLQLSFCAFTQCDSTQSEYFINIEPDLGTWRIVSWTITSDLSGDTILESDCSNYEGALNSFDTICLDNGFTYNFNAYSNKSWHEHTATIGYVNGAILYDSQPQNNFIDSVPDCGGLPFYLSTVIPINAEASIYGCMDSKAVNYNIEANVDDGSCLACDKSLARIVYHATFNKYIEDFDVELLINGLSVFVDINIGILPYGGNDLYYDTTYRCIPSGCAQLVIDDVTPLSSWEQDANIQIDHLDTNSNTWINDLTTIDLDTSIYTYVVDFGLEDSLFCEYGCTDVNANNFSITANLDDGSCLYCSEELIVLNMENLDGTFIMEYEIIKLDNDSIVASGPSSDSAIVDYHCLPEGCYVFATKNAITNNVHQWQLRNFDSTQYLSEIATTANYGFIIGDGDCNFIYGCTQEDAINYSDSATIDDYSCIQPYFYCDNAIEIGCNDSINVNLLNATFDTTIYNNFDDLCINGNFNNRSGVWLKYDAQFNSVIEFDVSISTNILAWKGDCDSLVCINNDMDNGLYYTYYNNAPIYGLPTLAGNSYLIFINRADWNNGWATIVVNCEDTMSASGCTDQLASNFDSNSYINDGSCDYLHTTCEGAFYFCDESVSETEWAVTYCPENPAQHAMTIHLDSGLNKNHEFHIYSGTEALITSNLLYAVPGSYYDPISGSFTADVEIDPSGCLTLYYQHFVFAPCYGASEVLNWHIECTALPDSIFGCMDTLACNYNFLVTDSNESCSYSLGNEDPCSAIELLEGTPETGVNYCANNWEYYISGNSNYDHAVTNGLWYTFTIEADTNVKIITTAGDLPNPINTQIVLLNGTCNDNLNLITTEDNLNNYESEIYDNLSAGTYFLLVDSEYGTLGSFEIGFELIHYGCNDPSALNYDSLANDISTDYSDCEYGSPNNDLCVNAIEIYQNQSTFLGNNINATADNSSGGSCWSNGSASNGTVWYSFEALSEEVTLMIDHLANIAAMAVYDNCPTDTGIYNEIACDTYINGWMGDFYSLTNLTVGHFYIIEVSTQSQSQQGHHKLSISGGVQGCIYPLAINFNTLATDDDGSCNFLGDIDGSYAVDVNDLNLFLSGYGCQVDCDGSDINNSGGVDVNDLNLFLGAFGDNYN